MLFPFDKNVLLEKVRQYENQIDYLEKKRHATMSLIRSIEERECLDEQVMSINEHINEQIKELTEDQPPLFSVIE